MQANDPVVIVGLARTPMGSMQGALRSFSAPELGGFAIRGALLNAGAQNSVIDEVILGCVLPAGAGQAPARQAALKAGLPNSVACSTVNKVCGSGMKAVMLGADALYLGHVNTVIAGGMESMTNAPHLLAKARSGYRLGHGELLDHMFTDGLQDAYSANLMGVFAEETAKKYGFSREQQDAFAIESLTRAKDAAAAGAFDREIVSIDVKQKAGLEAVCHDEPLTNARPDKIPMLKPAFANNGTVTAANSSSIADGAAALLLMRQSFAHAQGLKSVAKIVAQSEYSQAPEWFTTAPVGAINAVLRKAGWNAKDVDLWEINEAFAVVTLATISELALDSKKVNINGGACALGHPLGASGARILVTLISALQRLGLKRGVASLCIGGGEATAIALECTD